MSELDLEAIKARLGDYIELNMANYNEDDVAELNAWGIWGCEIVDALVAEVERLRAEEVALNQVIDNLLSQMLGQDGQSQSEIIQQSRKDEE